MLVAIYTLPTRLIPGPMKCSRNGIGPGIRFSLIPLVVHCSSRDIVENLVNLSFQPGRERKLASGGEGGPRVHKQKKNKMLTIGIK